MSKKILQELPELIEAGIISEATAEKIEIYYNQKSENTPNRLLVIFGILGALLVGLGIILIIAHNWDNLSKSIKTILAFIPLIIGQIACGYTLLKKPDNRSWSEGSSAFLFMAIGASISLISQIYNIPGDINSFILTWSLLALPLVYLMNSSVVSLLYIIAITNYGISKNYNYPYEESYIYWGLLALIIPHYYQLIKQRPNSNFTNIHHLFIGGTIAIMLFSFAERYGYGQIMVAAYTSLFAIYYMIGKSDFFKKQNPYLNFYQIIGSLGSLILLLFMSFRWWWDEWAEKTDFKETDFSWSKFLTSPEFLITTLVTGIGIYILFQKLKRKSFQELMPLKWVFIPIFLLFIVGKNFPLLNTIIINILVFIVGVMTVRRGVDSNHLGILNYGLLTITALAICRFFDLNLSFVFRGILFVLVGLGFFLANYRMLQKRK